MNWTESRIMTLCTILLAAFGSTMAFLCFSTYAGLYLPTIGAWVVGIIAAFVPGYLLNRSITRSYQKTVDVPASPLGSLFGSIAIVTTCGIGALWLGLAGIPGAVAVDEAFQQAGSTFGILPAIQSRAIDVYPRASWDGPLLRTPNVGSVRNPKVIVRQDNGELKILSVPRMGGTLAGNIPARLVSIEEQGKQISLIPLSNPSYKPVTYNGQGRIQDNDIPSYDPNSRVLSPVSVNESLPIKSGKSFSFSCKDGAVEISAPGGKLPSGMRLRLTPTTTEIDTR